MGDRSGWTPDRHSRSYDRARGADREPAFIGHGLPRTGGSRRASGMDRALLPQ